MVIESELESGQREEMLAQALEKAAQDVCSGNYCMALFADQDILRPGTFASPGPYGGSTGTGRVDTLHPPRPGHVHTHRISVSDCRSRWTYCTVTCRWCLLASPW